MESYVVACLVSLVLSVLVTPIVRRFALRIGAVSTPGGRHVHGRAIPRLGGIGLAFAWAVPVIGLALRDGMVMRALNGKWLQIITVVGGAAAICTVGALDDVRGLRSVYKFAAQILVAAVAFACGFQIQAIQLPLLGTLQMGAFALPVTVLWIVGVTNAVNLIDGLDGLAAGVAFFAAFTSFVIASISGSVFVALTMAALMGALVGFLFFNFNPARIFMGDSGSYFLGFVLATTALAGGGLQQKASTAVSLLVPVLALGVPIFDTLFSMFRRLVERRPIFSADRGHVHHSAARPRANSSARGHLLVWYFEPAGRGSHRRFARAKLARWPGTAFCVARIRRLCPISGLLRIHSFPQASAGAPAGSVHREPQASRPESNRFAVQGRGRGRCAERSRAPHDRNADILRRGADFRRRRRAGALLERHRGRHSEA